MSSVTSNRINVIRDHLNTSQKLGTLQCAGTMSSQSPLTTHILDTAKGCPARNVPLTLYIQQMTESWKPVAHGHTNNDGRCPGLVTQDQFPAGIYKITFDTGAYFKQTGVKGFYPYVDVVFEIVDPSQHYHVPLLLSPFGYSTYRGS